MNNANATATLGFRWKDVPGLGGVHTSCKVFDVWAGHSLGEVRGLGYTASGLAPRDSAFVTLSECR
eukprot:COSAG01_NODE_19_length_39011_cov_38.134968_35_plen_66_part_00